MAEQVLGMLGKLDEWSILSIIWVTLEQAKLLFQSCFKHIFEQINAPFLDHLGIPRNIGPRNMRGAFSIQC